MGNGRTKYLAKNTLLFTISSFGSKLISFFLVPLYTNVLTKAEYGTADLISTTVSLLLFVFSINISSGILRYAIDSDEYHGSYLKYGLNIFLLGFCLLCICLIPVTNTGIIGLDNSHYSYIILLYFFLGLSELLSNYFRARDKVWLITVAGISTTLVTVVGNIVLLLVVQMGFTGYMLSLIMGQAVSCVIFIAFGQPQILHQPKLSSLQKKEIVLYSLPLIFNGVAWWVNQSLDKYFITNMLTVDDNGIYAVAGKLPTILSTCLAIFIQAWNLSAIKEYDSDDSTEFYTNAYRVLRFCLCLCASVLIIVSVPVAKILFAKEFFIAWKYSLLLLLAGVFSGMSSFLGSVFSAAKKSNIFAYSTVAAAVVNIGLNFVLIPRYGIQGATMATAVSFFVIWIIRYICVQRIRRMKVGVMVEIVLYVLLVAQIILQQTDSHFYLIQVAIIVAILGLSWKEVLGVVKIAKSLLKKKN